jgi:hypothetical protein
MKVGMLGDMAEFCGQRWYYSSYSVPLANGGTHEVRIWDMIIIHAANKGFSPSVPGLEATAHISFLSACEFIHLASEGSQAAIAITTSQRIQPHFAGHQIWNGYMLQQQYPQHSDDARPCIYYRSSSHSSTPYIVTPTFYKTYKLELKVQTQHGTALSSSANAAAILQHTCAPIPAHGAQTSSPMRKNSFAT